MRPCCRLSPSLDADRQADLTDTAAAEANGATQQTEQEPTVDQQDLQQQQIQQLEAGSETSTDSQHQQQQQQLLGDEQDVEQSQGQQQQQTGVAQHEQAQQAQQQQSAMDTKQAQQAMAGAQNEEQQTAGQQVGNAAEAGIAAAGLTVEQAADKTHEHAMAAMMGGPPQWGGQFDNRSPLTWHMSLFLSCLLQPCKAYMLQLYTQPVLLILPADYVVSPGK